MPERPRSSKPITEPILLRDRNTRRYGGASGGSGGGGGAGGGVNWGGDIGVYGVGTYSRCWYGMKWGVYGAEKYGQAMYGTPRPFMPSLHSQTNILYLVVPIYPHYDGEDEAYEYDSNASGCYNVVFVDTTNTHCALSLPNGVDGLWHKVANVGTGGKTLYVYGDTDIEPAVMGEEYCELSDGEVLDIHYSEEAEGWW